MRPIYRCKDGEVFKWMETLAAGGYLQKTALHFHVYTKAYGVLAKNFGALCAYCELPLSNVAEIDHVYPKSKTGSLTAWQNLLLTCRSCNGHKSSNPLPWDPETKNFWESFVYVYNTSEEDILLGPRPGAPDATDASAFIEMFHLNDRAGLGSRGEGALAELGQLARRRRIVHDLAETLDTAGVELKRMVECAFCTGFWTLWVETLLKRSLTAERAAEVIHAFGYSPYFPGTDMERIVQAIENQWIQLPPGVKSADVEEELDGIDSEWRSEVHLVELREVRLLGGLDAKKNKNARTPGKTITRDKMLVGHTPKADRKRTLVF